MKDADLKIKVDEMRIAAWESLCLAERVGHEHSGYKSTEEMILDMLKRNRKRIDDFIEANLE